MAQRTSRTRPLKVLRAIRKLGNDRMPPVEDLFVALGRLYRGDSEKQDYLADLRTLRQQAETDGQKVLAVRTIWALAQAVRKSDPGLSQALLREASVLAEAPVTSPAVLADCAEAQMLTAEQQTDPAEATRRQELATDIYRDLLKWHPRARRRTKRWALGGWPSRRRHTDRPGLLCGSGYPAPPGEEC